MNWILVGLCVLCIVMSCMALRYKKKWQEAKKRVEWESSLANIHEKNAKSMFGNMLTISFTLDQLRKEIKQLRRQLLKQDNK